MTSSSTNPFHFGLSVLGLTLIIIVCSQTTSAANIKRHHSSSEKQDLIDLLKILISQEKAELYSNSEPSSHEKHTDDKFSYAGCGLPAIAPVVTTRSHGSRIINGTEAVPHSWPWQCRVEINLNGDDYVDIICGATVISNNAFVLTAARCVVGLDHSVRPTSTFQVICGDHDQDNPDPNTIQRSGVTSVVVHKSYGTPLYANDIAVLQLETSLAFNDYVSPVCLPSSDVPTGTKCVVTGWGVTRGTGNPNVLNQVVVPTYDQTTCNNNYGGIIISSMLCAGYDAGGKDSCAGDTGGPLVCNDGTRWFQHGIVSFSGQGCAQPHLPGVYTRVTQLMSWIGDKTGVTPA